MKEERVEYNKEEDVENKYVNVENEEEDNAKNKEENVENEKYPNKNWMLCINFVFKIA